MKSSLTSIETGDRCNSARGCGYNTTEEMLKYDCISYSSLHTWFEQVMTLVAQHLDGKVRKFSDYIDSLR